MTAQIRIILRDLILVRGSAGTPTEAYMTGCVIPYSNIMPDDERI